MAITLDYQFEFNSLLIGAGTAYEVAKVQGLDMPDVRARTFEPYRHGLVIAGAHHLDAREVRIDVEVFGTPGTDVANKLAALATATQPNATPTVMSFQLEGESTRRLNVCPIGRRISYEVTTVRGLTPVALRFVAYDPRIYADVATATTITIASAGTSGSGSVTNAGTFETEPTVTLNGGVPTVFFTLTNASDSSRVVKILTTGLATADVIVVNFALRTVTVNGVNRYDLVDPTTRWWRLLGGANSITAARSGADAFASAFAFSHRSAWV